MLQASKKLVDKAMIKAVLLAALLAVTGREFLHMYLPFGVMCCAVKTETNWRFDIVMSKSRKPSGNATFHEPRSFAIGSDASGSGDATK